MKGKFREHKIQVAKNRKEDSILGAGTIQEKISEH
jgi:hypothetical protein